MTNREPEEAAERYYNAAEKYYIKGRYRRALKLFQASFSLLQSNNCLNYVGCCFLALQDYLSAMRVFKKVVAECPDWERPVFNLGRAYLELGKMDKASEYFSRAVQMNPYNPDSFYYLGLYYYKLDDFQSARRNFQMSLSLDDKEPEPHLHLGLCFLKLKMYHDALREIDYACKLDKNWGKAIHYKGVVHFILKEYQKALDQLLILHRLEPDNLENMVRIAHTYFRLRDLSNAHNWLEKVLSMDPGHGNATRLLREIKLFEERISDKS